MFVKRLLRPYTHVFSNTFTKRHIFNVSQKVKQKAAIGAGIFTGACIIGQSYYGSTHDFYDYRFITTADPNDLAEFYGNEDFMEIFCIFPFMVDFMMRSGHFDDSGHVHTFGLPPFISKMVVSMQFEDKEENDTTVCFNKKERFKCIDSLFGFTIWEMVQNFGYTQRDDNTSEVYHYGQSWYGPFFIRLLFHLHAAYVMYATEQHINSDKFLHRKEEEEDLLLAQRHNIPLHLMNQFLDGLEMDIKNKLNSILKKNSHSNDEEIDNLHKKVTQLETLVKELEHAKQIRTTKLEKYKRHTPNGSVKEFYSRTLSRRASALHIQHKEQHTEPFTKILEQALEHVDVKELKKKYTQN